MADLGWPRAIDRCVRMGANIRGNTHRQAIGRIEAEAEAAAGGCRKVSEAADFSAERFRTLRQALDRRAVAGRHVNRQELRLGLFAQGENMMFDTGAAQVHHARVCPHLGQAPDVAIEFH